MLFAIRFVLVVDNITYRILNILLRKKFGKHPKHRLIRYPEWFCERVSRNDVVMDVGCGDGVVTEMIAPNVREVVAVDLMPKYSPSDSSKNVTFLVADATKLDKCITKKVTVVVLSNVLEHIEDRVGFLKSLVAFQSLKHVLIRVPDFNRSWLVGIKKSLGVEWRSDPTHFIEHTKEELVEEIEAAGLIIRHYEQRFGEHYVVAIKQSKN